jgi:hypothetical protein
MTFPTDAVLAVIPTVRPKPLHCRPSGRDDPTQPMTNRFRRPAATGLSLALAISIAAPTPAGAATATQPFAFGSSGSYASMQLPQHTRDVELLSQRAGNCRFGRTWGFDLARHELWADQGCTGTFRALVEPPAQAPAAAGNATTPGAVDSSAVAAAAAIAAIAGIAILSHNKHRSDNPPGYQQPPGYPPPPQAYGGAIQGVGGLCLDIRGGDPVQAGSPTIVWQCTGRGNQAFAWTRRGELRVGGLCLDIANAANTNGATVGAWPCNGGGNQQWTFDRGTIRSRLNGRCLDVQNGRAQPGTPVAMWDCNGRANQLWRG